ncbi:MAG TPA: hypothetical protein VGR96_07555 [Acidobacteriaceae bacterium]|nr:hypothetical protein [Acidobacteriaceae bacterium]
MNANLKTLAVLALASAMTAGQAQTTAPTTSSSSSAKKTTPHRRTAKETAAKPSVESQIESLRQEMQTQIQQLRQELSDREQQLQQAQQAAAAAQAAAAQAQQQAQQQADTLTQNAQTVSNLQGAVTDLKANNASLVGTIQENQTRVQKAIDSPDAIHFKGATISPTGSFIAAETVYRQRATGGGLNTPFNGIPLNAQPQGQYSEFYGSGRQSRVALLGEGKLDNMAIRGYYEGDWLGTGITSNNNQSNSYVLRQRQMWAQAELNSGWAFTGGQMWSLATETTKGLQNRSEILPSTIDPQYAAGFVWLRQYGFRVTKNFGNKLFLGASAENAQTPSVVGHNLPYNFIVGQTGNGGGLYNPTANYASNVAPDFIAKLAFEPGWGHYEIFGIGRFFRARVYPNDTGSTSSSVGAYNDSTTGGGIGGGFRVPTFQKHLDVGLKGLWGDGIGRYGSSQIADTTARPDGQLALIHGFSAIGTLEFHFTPRLDVYMNYGGDYSGRRYFMTAPGKATGYGSPFNVESGCNVEPAPSSSNNGYAPGSQSNCVADTKDVKEFIAGYWYNFYSGPKGRLRQGIQYSYFRRDIWSGVGAAPQSNNNMFWTSFRYYLP